MKYSKPALSLQDQLRKWKHRGLIVSDDQAASELLWNLGYYRLAGYVFPFLDPPARKAFKAGTRVEDIAGLYEFDRRLRLLIMDGIERAEVGVRSRIVNHSCQALGGGHWFTNPAHFHRGFNHTEFIAKIEKDLGIRYNSAGTPSLPTRHSETFIAHYYQKYGDPWLPPFWMTAELLTLGSLSFLYRGLGDATLKATISTPFGVAAQVFEGWLHCLSHLRNVCAHHGRLWNRVFSINPRVSAKHRGIIHSPDRLEAQLVVLLSVLDLLGEAAGFKSKFKGLLIGFPQVDPSAMGFPASWEALPFWKT